MAKITGPLMSLEAHGTVGPRLTFSSRKTGQQVRFQNKQVDVSSAGQLTQRQNFLMGKKIWNNMTSAQRAEYENYTIANQLNLTGYNLFLKRNMDLAEILKDAKGYWPFNSVSGGVTPDLSSAGNDGTITGATLVSGKFGQCYSLDGTDDYINVGTMGDFGSNHLVEFTFCGWVKSNVTDSLIRVAGTFNDGSTTGFQSILNADEANNVIAGKLNFYFRDDDSKALAAATTNSVGITDGDWHFLEVYGKASTNTIVIKVDGDSKAITYKNQTTPSNFSNFQYGVLIGAGNNRGTPDVFYNGLLDEPMFYAGQLTSAQSARIRELTKLN